MSNPRIPKPTEAELELLEILWQRGPSTVRDVHDALRRTKATGYTTTLKILQKMADKGLVVRDESSRSHIYQPAARPEETRRQLAGDLLHRAFGGSAAQLMVAALGARRACPEELAEIRRLLDAIENQTPNPTAP